MGLKFEIRMIDPASFEKAQNQRALEINEASAKEYVKTTCENIRSGRAPDGSGQKKNAPSTSKAKRARLGHSKPLVDSELLSSPEFWRIKVVRGSVIVMAPEQRTQVLFYLSRKGYKTAGIDPRFLANHRARMAKGFSRTLPGIRYKTIRGGS